jgi:photosystem II stability/assembly factor-like uncharacterized protein
MRAFQALIGAVIVIGAAAGAHAGATSYVNGRMPIAGPSREVAAMRPAGLTPSRAAMTPPGRRVNTWTKLGTMSGAVVHDVAFVSPTAGYAAAELGQVWATTDGGKTWSSILNRGFPYYYYGIQVSGQTIVASGFNDSTSQGILTQSNDGGATWQPDTILSETAWAGRVRFTKGVGHGLAMNGGGSSGSNPNIAWWTRKPDHWQTDVPDPNGGWFGNQFTLLKDKSAFASGITFCKSGDIGATWTCAPPADSVFDGPTLFIDDLHGWTGGGEISPDVAGWLHRTANGGATWSGRVLNTAWPIRQIEFLDKRIGWAAGGNVYSNVGGIYFTKNGGKTWSLDVTTGDEMGACAHRPIAGGDQTQVWCIGFLFNGSSFNSETYTTTVSTP